MGLFDFMKQKGRRTAEPVSYVPECLELPKSNYDEIFDEFQPEWADSNHNYFNLEHARYVQHCPAGRSESRGSCSSGQQFAR
jgi:hypothetical protein